MIGELRSILHYPPHPNNWAKLWALLDSDQPLDQATLHYLRSFLDAWPASFRAPLTRPKAAQWPIVGSLSAHDLRRWYAWLPRPYARRPLNRSRHIGELLSSDRLNGLRKLRLSAMVLHADELRAISTNRALVGLRELELNHCGLCRDATVLLRAPFLEGLRELNLCDNPELSRPLTRELLDRTTALEVLKVSQLHDARHALADVLLAGGLSRLRELHHSETLPPRSKALFEALNQADALRALHLHAVDQPFEGLLRCPELLANLEILHLGRPRAPFPPPTRSALKQALAQMRHLRHLVLRGFIYRPAQILSTLAELPQLRQLESLVVRVGFHPDAHDISEALETMLRAGPWPSLRRLELNWSFVDGPVMRRLARREAMPALDEVTGAAFLPRCSDDDLHDISETPGCPSSLRAAALSLLARRGDA